MSELIISILEEQRDSINQQLEDLKDYPAVGEEVQAIDDEIEKLEEDLIEIEGKLVAEMTKYQNSEYERSV